MKSRLPAGTTKEQKPGGDKPGVRQHWLDSAALANLGAVGYRSRSRGGLWKGTWNSPIAAIPVEGSQRGYL